MNSQHLSLFALLTLISLTPRTSCTPCLWKMCDQIKMPNPREGNVLEIYTCDFTSSNFEVRPGDSSKSCNMPSIMNRLRNVPFKFRMNDVGLKTFPPDLCEFANLSELDLQRNNLVELPNNLPSNCFLHLKQLLLNVNKLRKLDLSVVLRFSKLEVLEVEQNELDIIYLSQQPPNNSQLRVIKAARSQLKTIDMSVVRLTALNLVDLSRNQIGKVTNLLNWDWKSHANSVNNERRQLAISGKFGLQYRYLLTVLFRNNVFTNGFHKGLLWGVNLGSSLFNHNALLGAMIRMKQAFEFLSIDVGGSRVECDCYSQTVVKLLRKYLTQERLTQVGIAKTLGPLLTLKCSKPKVYIHRSLLDLSENDLYCERLRNCPKSCACTEFMNGSYVAINCKHADLNKLPEKLPIPLQPHATFDLQMSGNNISQIDLSKLPFAKRVGHLDLRRNHITDVKGLISALHGFTRLSVLDLRHNPIRVLSPELLNLTDSVTPHNVKLSPDQLNCQCDYFRLETLRRVLTIFPHFNEQYCLQRGHRQRIQTFKVHYCRRQELDDPKLQNATMYKNPKIESLPPDNQWLLIVVASGAAVIITGLIIITVVILGRYWCREKRLRQKKYSRPPPPPVVSQTATPPSQPTTTLVESELKLLRENPYAEYRLSFLSDSPPGQFDCSLPEPGAGPGQEDSAYLLGNSYRVATVHPRVPSRLSLRRCAEEGDNKDDDVFADNDPKTERVDSNGNKEDAPGHPLSQRQRSAPRLCGDPEEDSAAGNGSRRLRGATSMPKVPPMPPPRGGSTLTRSGTLPRQANLTNAPKPLETDL